MNEKELIEKTIDTLAQLDEYLEKLTDNNIEKVNIYTKTKELVFWLTYYKDKGSDIEWVKI